MRKIDVYILTLLVCIFCACQSVPKDPEERDKLPCIVPDYTGVTIPVGVAPLNFGMTDVDCIDVVVKGSKGGELHVNGTFADFDIEAWHEITQQNAGDSLLVMVCARRDGHWTKYKPFPIFISKDPLDEWGVTYRLIPPGYESYGLMGIYQRDLSNFDQTAIIENNNIDGQCINCHTPNLTNPDAFTLHVRGQYGATIVRTKESLDILEPKNETLGGSMVYPFWHPSGQYIAYSTNQTHQNFHQLKDRRVEVYDEKSDVIIYNTATHQILVDSIVAQKDHLENYPVFSPEGKALYFCDAQRVDSIWKNYRDVKYNICRIGFDAVTGKFNSQVDTVVHARIIGKSAVMPRVSYDGRFLLYTLCDYGCFPIWHPEADLWMNDLESGESFPLERANSADADSFHNWSQNSQWIVFTSRRDDGLYTKLYFAHINSDGRADKAFCLPQRNPIEYNDETIWSFNTPDFASAPIRLDRDALYRQILSGQRMKTVVSKN